MCVIICFIYSNSENITCHLSEVAGISMGSDEGGKERRDLQLKELKYADNTVLIARIVERESERK